MNTTNFLFVIDTDQYAGNFYREICAYVTGAIGDCSAGHNYAEIFEKEVPKGEEMFDNITYETDDKGHTRPSVIWNNPRYGNDGVNNNYLIKGADQAKLRAQYAKSVKEMLAPYIKEMQKIIKDLKVDEDSHRAWTIKDAQKEIAKYEKRIAETEKIKKVPCGPAYLSVGIYFSERPSEKQIKLMKERAEKFPAVRMKLEKKWYIGQIPIKIKGFRLIEFKRSQVEKVV